MPPKSSEKLLGKTKCFISKSLTEISIPICVRSEAKNRHFVLI